MFNAMMMSGAEPPVQTYEETIVITGSVGVNLRTLADNNTPAYNGTDPTNITWTLASGVTITGLGTGGHGVDTGVWPSGVSHSHEIQITGTVIGGGGDGGTGGSGLGGDGVDGTDGGDAINCQENITVVVNSGGVLEAAGGGGGGGGGASYPASEPLAYSGGGGGGGYPNGDAGAAGSSANFTGTAGTAGTTGGGGAGGAGAGDAGNGGIGGNINSGGGNGTGGTSSHINGAGGALGSAGYGVRKNGNTVLVTNNGTITGTQG